MPTQKQIYTSEAAHYEALVSHEDYQHNIGRALDDIRPVDGLDVIDLGAGTGRLAALLAPRARSVRAFDISHHMLGTARDKLKAASGKLSLAAVADHLHLPAGSASADMIVSGWSVSYLAVWTPERWQERLDGWLREAQRVMRKGGTVILLESLGTGNESPQRLPHLENVYLWLDQTGFNDKWIRTDYRFESIEQAAELAGFFFGEDMQRRIREQGSVILPECTGIWWLQA